MEILHWLRDNRKVYVKLMEQVSRGLACGIIEERKLQKTEALELCKKINELASQLWFKKFIYYVVKNNAEKKNVQLQKTFNFSFVLVLGYSYAMGAQVDL